MRSCARTGISFLLTLACAPPPARPPDGAPPAPVATAVVLAPAEKRDPGGAAPNPPATPSALPPMFPRFSQSEEDGLTPLDPEVSGDAPLDFFELRLTPGGAFFPHDREVHVAFVVLEGVVSTSLGDVPPASLRPWAGLYVPEAGFGVHATGALARVLLIVKSPHGTTVRISADPGQKSFRRKTPPRAVAFEAQAPLTWGGGAFHGRIGLDTVPNTPAFALNAIVFGKDAIVQSHRHESAWECIAVVQGDGELSSSATGKLEKVHLGKGQLACIPEGATHAWTPSGKEPLVAIQLYSPPGPEQRWKALAAPP